MLQVPATPWVGAEPVGALVMAVCHLSTHDGDQGAAIVGCDATCFGQASAQSEILALRPLFLRPLASLVDTGLSTAQSRPAI
jgi:hypothetical protein